MTPTQTARYRGAMIGTLCGDALGAPYEWKSPDIIADDFSRRGGLKVFDYIDPWKGKRQVAAGQPTDDSELAAALAQSLVACRGFNGVDLYQRLRNFIHGNTPVGRQSILTEKAYGSGGTLRAALEPPTYQESLAKFRARSIPRPPSNGSLMRSIAVPLLSFRDTDSMLRLSRAQSRVTHRNSSCVAACAAYSVMVGYVLFGLSPIRAWEMTKEYLKKRMPKDRFMREVLAIEISKPSYTGDMLGREGWVVLSLRVAVWASVSAVDFRDGITKAVSVGGDTDTYAAIAGGILGAYYGLENIPEEWLHVLQGRHIMQELADQLYELGHPELAVPKA